MADFCQQCSIELFGKDTRDLAGLVTGEEAVPTVAAVICEGCGFTVVDKDGKCVGGRCSNPKHNANKKEKRD